MGNDDAPPIGNIPRLPVPAPAFFAALTVIKGQAQLIRRRADHAGEPDGASIARSADAIGRAVDGLLASIENGSIVESASDQE